MANTSFNTLGIIISDTTPSITGSFSGFYVISDTTFTGLKDYNGLDLAINGLDAVVIPTNTFIPLYVTSASISSGTVLFYPISTTIPQQ
jgi:hypothetical protein